MKAFGSFVPYRFLSSRANVPFVREQFSPRNREVADGNSGSLAPTPSTDQTPDFMTREEMKVIISVYQLWLTEKKEELVADLCGADCAEPKGKTIEKKRRSRKAVSALAYHFAF